MSQSDIHLVVVVVVEHKNKMFYSVDANFTIYDIARIPKTHPNNTTNTLIKSIKIPSKMIYSCRLRRFDFDVFRKKKRPTSMKR